MNRKLTHILVFFLLFSSQNLLHGQVGLKKIKYQTEIGTIISSSNQTPFWLRSNQYGTVPLQAQLLTLRGSAHKEYDSLYSKNKKLKNFSYGYGINTVINVGKINQFILPEAYIKIRYKDFEIYGGRRKEVFGLVDTSLTLGSLIWSGNSLPIPKIQFSIPEYTPILGKGLFSIKGHYAHGWFENQGETRNFFLHQKTLYARVGKPNWKIKMYGGFNHQVQWGGYPVKPYNETQTGKLITTYGNDFATYWNVVSGISLNKKGGSDIPGVPLNEAWNRSGNHLGTIDIGLEFKLKNSNLSVYRQSIYDDGSLFYLNNISDGLLGLSFKRKLSHQKNIAFTFEYLNTANQGGDGGSGNTIPELRGQDNYFNNSIYGWVYKQQTIGVPFIMTIKSLNPKLYSNYAYLEKALPEALLMNNRVRGIYLACKYVKNTTSFVSKVSLTKNMGVYGNLWSAQQLSLMESFEFPYRKTKINLNIGYDTDGVLKSNIGSSISIKRNI